MRPEQEKAASRPTEPLLSLDVEVSQQTVAIALRVAGSATAEGPPDPRRCLGGGRGNERQLSVSRVVGA